MDEPPPPEQNVIDDPDNCTLNEADGERIEEDRIPGDYKGRKVKALYENGWFECTITYFNKCFEEYRVVYQDESGDYISPNDIDGVEVQLI